MSYNLTGLLYPSLLGRINLTDHKMTKYKISDIKYKICQFSEYHILKIKFQMSDIRYQVSEIKYYTLN